VTAIPDPEGFLEELAAWEARSSPSRRRALAALAWIDQLSIAQTSRYAPYGYLGVPQGALPYSVRRSDGTPNLPFGAVVWISAIPGARAWCLFQRCPDGHLRCTRIEDGEPPLDDWDDFEFDEEDPY
jgi:hypothetical protein